MATTIILIGPVRSGKTTIGKLLAERLGTRGVSLDDAYERYRQLLDEDTRAIDEAQLRAWAANGNWASVFWALRPVDAAVLQRFLADHPPPCGRVIDLGAGHSVYDGELLDFVAALLAPYDNVVLLLPSPDRDRSEALLRERLTYPMHVALNPLFVHHPSNSRLAKWVVYTAGRQPEEACEEILERTAGPPEDDS